MFGRRPLPALHRLNRPPRCVDRRLIRFQAAVSEGDGSRHGEVPGWKGFAWHLVSQGCEGGDAYVERLVLQIPQGHVRLRHDVPRPLGAETGRRPPGAGRAPQPPRHRQPNDYQKAHQEPEERTGESRLMTAHAWSLRRNGRGGRRIGHRQGARQPIPRIP